MATKEDLQKWIVEALRQRGGSAHHVDVAKLVWQVHEQDLRASGDLFYTWQYDLRWAALRLRAADRLQPVGGRGKGDGTWTLKDG